MRNNDIESEANLFALFLLMPEKFVDKDFREDFDLADDTRMKELAKKYGVSVTAVCVRYSIWSKHRQQN